MNYKKLTIIVLVSVVLITSSIFLAIKLSKSVEMQLGVGEEEYVVNGTTKTFDAKRETLPVIDENTKKMLLPLRFIVEELGGNMEWNDKDKAVVIRYQNKNLRIKTGDTKAALNGYGIDLKDAPKNYNSCIYVTSDFFADYFGVEITWNEGNNQITLKKEQEKSPVIAVNILDHEQNAAKYRVEMPVFTGLNDINYEKNLNYQVSNEIVTQVQKFITQAKREVTDGENQYLYNSNVSVAYKNEKWISVYLNGEQTTDKGTKILKNAINIDLQKQKNADIQDLFKNDKYIKMISEAFNTKEDVTVREDFGFYLNKEKELVVFIDDEESKTIKEVSFNLSSIKNQLKGSYDFLWKEKKPK